MYKSFIRPLLFKFDPEKIHHFTFGALKNIFRIPGATTIAQKYFCVENPQLKKSVFGLEFKNPVGLAAGFDKDAKLFKELSCLGFGFVEIGTLTPKPQPGNPKKRLFRLKEDHALINRMGFNNEGVLAAVERLKQRESQPDFFKNILIGGNIGKNKTTPNEKAAEDYFYCFEKLFPYVDYFVVNVSSPNTPNLRELQEKQPLTDLLNGIQKLNHQKKHPKPILLKIAPDLTNDQLMDIIEIVSITGTAGVIATNTSISREGLHSENKKQTGGMSGKPLKNRSTEVIRFLAEKSKGQFPIIGVGGIHSPEDALEKIKAGASLVQIYTGFIYEGPQLVRKINEKLILKGER